MNRNKLMTIIVVGLLLSNIALVYFLLHGHQRPNHDGPRDIIIERLHFDSKQIEDYDRLITKHRRDIREKQDEMLKMKQKLYSTLTLDSSGVTIYPPLSRLPQSVLTDSLRNEIGNIQEQIEEINYMHFHDISKLCKPEQIKDYNELIKDIAGLFAPPRPQQK
jgi:protein CpxP